MKLAFEEQRQVGYESGSQKARVLTEAWAASEAFCPNCGAERLTKFQNNQPVADFYCTTCNEEFELKSQKASFGSRVADGAYGAMCRRLAERNNPNLMLLNYTPTVGVNNLMIVPKHFFVEDAIEKRKPLAHMRGALDGSAATFCFHVFPKPAKYTSFATRSSPIGETSSANGGRRSS